MGMTVWWWVGMTGWDCTGGGIGGFSLSVFLSRPSSPHTGDIVGPLPPPPPMTTLAPIVAESNPDHPIPSQTTPTHLGTPLPPGPSNSPTPPPCPHTPLPSGSPGPPLPIRAPLGRAQLRSYVSVTGMPHTPRIATSTPHRQATPRTLLPMPATVPATITCQFL